MLNTSAAKFSNLSVQKVYQLKFKSQLYINMLVHSFFFFKLPTQEVGVK